MKDSKRNRTNQKRNQSRKFHPVSKYAAKQSVVALPVVKLSTDIPDCRSFNR